MMSHKLRIVLLHHLQIELAARRKYLAFWEKQEPIELFSPPVFFEDIRSNLVEAARSEIKIMEHAIQLLENNDTQGP
jgi:hypothetical protein